MSVVTFGFAQLLRVLPRSAISKALGSLCELELPAPLAKAVVSTYSRAYQVATHEADPAGMPYRSFDAFFTRRLRDGMRPLEGDDFDFASPADGVLSALGKTEHGGRMRVKGQDYTLEELLDDAGFARELEGGGYGVVYLSPRDYHRVHSPVSGDIVRVRGLEGDRWPVNSIGERYVKGLFVRNRRVSIEIRSPEWGRVAVILVGAMVVGRMTVACVDQPDVQGDHRFDVPRKIARGGELGAFHLGSTVVFAVGPAAYDRWQRSLGPIAYGQSIGSAQPLDAPRVFGGGVERGRA